MMVHDDGPEAPCLPETRAVITCPQCGEETLTKCITTDRWRCPCGYEEVR